MGTFMKYGTKGTKVELLSRDYILHVVVMYWFIKHQKYILNIIYELKINWNSKYDPSYEKHLNFLQHVLHYNQKYNFASNHYHKFWTILVIKDVQNPYILTCFLAS